ncbi:crossover junction endonuclease EME1-like isoform X2 [Mytilus californianus]|uniref:crossover junction endonuclease EME1-like isoform X2 n=1 Tax=Mytilus californianus TaxID=6549 RepID=UPI002247B4D1|nr:crossover junction endonuclease EME1-like isoform X2 [Mytilus californianus]
MEADILAFSEFSGFSLTLIDSFFGGKVNFKMSINISDEDVAQVSLLCPDADEDYIRHNLSITGDVNTTINSILDGNVNRLLNTDFDSDEELPPLSLKQHIQPENIVIVLDSNEPGCMKMSSNYKGKDCSKHARKIPYSKNDFLSDSSDIENDVEMVETLSLKERLLGKQSTFTSNGLVGNLMGTSIKCDQYDQRQESSGLTCTLTESFKNMRTKNVIEIIECCNLDDEMSKESNSCDTNLSEKSNQDYSKTSNTSNTTECVNKNKTVELNLLELGKSDKPIKRKRTLEEIEDRKRQAQLKKEFAEQKKLEREKVQLEKKKNVQIRKIQGERKKQMGAWNQSLEFMKIVLDPHIINDCGLGAAIFKAGEELKVPCVTEEQGFPFTISWKRMVTEWIENGTQVETLKREVTEDEALIILPVSDFVHMVENSKQDGFEGKTTLLQYIQIVQQRQPRISITPAVIGLEKYFRDLKTIKQRQHREAVLATGESSQTTKKKKNINTIVSRIHVEEACAEVQLQTGCVVQMLETTEEITDLIKIFTKAVAEKPAKKDRLNSIFSFHEDGTTGVKVDKSGQGLLKVWKQQLLQFKNVSPDMAEAIIAEYPSPQLLMKAYSMCSSQEEGVKVLDNIVVRRGAGVLETTRRIGKEMSRRFYLFFTNTDPSCTIK